MREIKFRGMYKDDESHTWVKGFLTYLPQEGWAILNGGGTWRVDPDTIGQFTGLRDKNGREIYEGDIVDFVEFRYGSNDVPRRGVVYFCDAAFWIDVDEEHIFALSWVVRPDNPVKVIGNIHKNPELLKGAEE